jgi:tRNA(Ile2) C34 agmatinyltransferase TiaS
MYMKVCPECEGKSYSSGRSNWICPYCGEDLNDIVAEQPES